MSDVPISSRLKTNLFQTFTKISSSFFFFQSADRSSGGESELSAATAVWPPDGGEGGGWQEKDQVEKELRAGKEEVVMKWCFQR